ncbi:class A beta-lactamase, subclass A2 [Mucilaginibacter sp. BT774]|uniref:class A beta-lactamase, subclass A2 n=1 Tax=Mucilaginibacter sp. BT774 TaxID=3062276 RepID=UPI00267455E0|nr:class A beta-lactamase, subclass A2 [Mucilaginibacter sp. BT774]MDO3627886.1 class A beta-lactamase, subclass A2 [Mucilaginibacter sp. BT774]
MKKQYLPILLLVILLFPRFTKAQDSLKNQIVQIAKQSKGILGVSILGIETRDTLNYNANSRLVMHSVMKFPIAMTVLNLVDKGKYKLDQKMKVGRGDMYPNTWSPLRDKYPDGAEITLGELLSYMVSQSDNNACDFLLKKLGGTQTVLKYLYSLGIKGINIVASEGDMAKAWEVQYTNWCKPADVVRLLDLFYQGKVLSKSSNDFLYKIMTETTTGPKRLKGLLPADAVVAHKTGTSPTNDEGLTPATNDVGIITLPNAKHLAIAVLVCNSRADDATRDLVIAQIAKAAWDFYGH